jgi:hypothetical protein
MSENYFRFVAPPGVYVLNPFDERTPRGFWLSCQFLEHPTGIEIHRKVRKDRNNHLQKTSHDYLLLAYLFPCMFYNTKMSLLLEPVVLVWKYVWGTLISTYTIA